MRASRLEVFFFIFFLPIEGPGAAAGSLFVQGA